MTIPTIHMQPIESCEQKLLNNDQNRKFCIIRAAPSKSNRVTPSKSVNSIAKRRWNILAKALHIRRRSPENVLAKKQADEEILIGTNESQPNQTDDYLASVRRFTSFNLFHQTPCNPQTVTNESNGNWMVFQTIVGGFEYSVIVHQLKQNFTPNDLIGFNNTGNICVWPSEETLAFYLLSHLNKFKQKRVLELGGGMTCLAGLLVAKYGGADCVHMTDGNQLSVKNANLMLSENTTNSFTETRCSVLKWEDVVETIDGSQQFDCILSADCLFFDAARCSFIQTLSKLMKPTGFGLIMAPRRGGTLMNFVQHAEEIGFVCKIQNCYDSVVWQKHLQLLDNKCYDEDIHYPVLIELRKL